MEVSLDEGTRWVKLKEITQKCRKLCETGIIHQILDETAREDDAEDFSDLEEELATGYVTQARVDDIINDLVKCKLLCKREDTLIALPVEDEADIDRDTNTSKGLEASAREAKKRPHIRAYDAAIENEAVLAAAWPSWRPQRRYARIHIRASTELPKSAFPVSASNEHNQNGAADSSDPNEDMDSINARLVEQATELARATMQELGPLRRPKTARSLHKQEILSSVVAEVMGDANFLNNDPARGWHREIKQRKNGEKCERQSFLLAQTPIAIFLAPTGDCFYYPPDGTSQLRSRHDVSRYFDENPEAKRAIQHETGKDIILDDNNFTLAQKNATDAELRRCRPIDLARVNLETNSLWDALSDTDRMAYEARAAASREAADSFALDLARKIRVKVFDSLQSETDYADALRIAIDAAIECVETVDWTALLTDDVSSSVKAHLDVHFSKVGQAQHVRSGVSNGTSGVLSRPRRNAATNIDFSDRPKSVPEIVAESLASASDVEALDWPALAERIMQSEANKQESRRCQPLIENTSKATREGLAALLKHFKAQRQFADLSRDVDAWRLSEESDSDQVDDKVDQHGQSLAFYRRRHRRTEATARALVLKHLSQPNQPPRDAVKCEIANADDSFINRRIEIDGLLGVVVSKHTEHVNEKQSAATTYIVQLDDGQTRTQYSGVEVARAIARCGQPEILWPELASHVDSLVHTNVQIFWPEDEVFYEGKVVAVEFGDPIVGSRPAGPHVSYAHRHLVLYEDGSSEWLDLRRERVRFASATKAHKDCVKLLVKLELADMNGFFSKPVNAEELGLNDYHDVIERPMDLETIECRLHAGVYDFAAKISDASDSSFLDTSRDKQVAANIHAGVRSDLELTYKNAIRYNDNVIQRQAVADEARRLLRITATLFGPDAEKYTESKRGKQTSNRPLKRRKREDTDDDEPFEPDEHDNDDDDEDVRHGRSRGVRSPDGRRQLVEKLYTFDQLLAAMPIYFDAESFGHPPGFELKEASVRTRKVKKYIISKSEVEQQAQYDPTATIPGSSDGGDQAVSEVKDNKLEFIGRHTLETDYFEALHARAFPAKDGRPAPPYLGAVIGQRWEIRSQVARVALGHVLGTLVRSGHVVEVCDEGEGRAFVAAHVYRKGTPPVLERRPRAKAEMQTEQRVKPAVD